MSKSKAPAVPPVQPYPDRGGSFVLDEGSMTLTPAETAGEPPVQAPVEIGPIETGLEPAPEQEPQ